MFLNFREKEKEMKLNFIIDVKRVPNDESGRCFNQSFRKTLEFEALPPIGIDLFDSTTGDCLGTIRNVLVDTEGQFDVIVNGGSGKERFQRMLLLLDKGWEQANM